MLHLGNPWYIKGFFFIVIYKNSTRIMSCWRIAGKPFFQWSIPMFLGLNWLK